MKKLFREHRGGLAESMSTVKEVENLDDVWKISDIEQYGYKKELKCKPYGYDNRIGWETWIIACEGYGVLGFSNCELK